MLMAESLREIRRKGQLHGFEILTRSTSPRRNHWRRSGDAPPGAEFLGVFDLPKGPASSGSARRARQSAAALSPHNGIVLDFCPDVLAPVSSAAQNR